MDSPRRAVVFSCDETDPGRRAEPRAARAPHDRRTGRDHDPRLQASRHDRPLRGHERRCREVLSDARRSHNAANVLAFSKVRDLHVSKDLIVDVVLDSLSAHKAPPVAKWLADPKRA